MLNYIWLGLIIAAVFLGGLNGQIGAVTTAAFEACKTAVMTIALPLAGIMALWLGIMRLAERAGCIAALARWLRPLMTRLFPDVPADHPAMGAMIMNMAANMLGLANAATPLGLRAMQLLETLNRRPGTATNAMCTFLALNTSSVQLIPATAVAVLAAAGSVQPTAIIGTALVATCCSTLAGLLAVKSFEKLPLYRLPEEQVAGPLVAVEAAADGAEPAASPAPAPLEWWGRVLLWLFVAFFGVTWWKAATAGAGGAWPGFAGSIESISLLAVPFLLSFFPLYAALRRVPVYEEFVEGAKEGFQVAVRVLPFLVAILAAIGMFRAAGGITLLSRGLQPVLDWVGLPSELLPLVLMRPLSGSGTMGIFSELVTTHGPDSLIARMGGTIMGSTETTFYVIAVYFGSVAVRRSRHAVPAGLVADAAGVAASVLVCRLVFL